MARGLSLRELNDDELLRRLGDARHDLFKARFDHATGQLDNSARLGQLRREIARVETLVRERELAAIDEGVHNGQS